MKHNAWIFVGLLIVGLLSAICAVSFFLIPMPAEVQHSEVPSEIATSTSVPETPTPIPSSGSVDMDGIFPQDSLAERDLVIFSCSNCHTWVCVVRGQRSAGHWRSIQFIHDRSLFPRLSDEDYERLFDFLAENFNDEKPEPELPVELENVGCTYAW